MVCQDDRGMNDHCTRDMIAYMPVLGLVWPHAVATHALLNSDSATPTLPHAMCHRIYPIQGTFRISAGLKIVVVKLSESHISAACLHVYPARDT